MTDDLPFYVAMLVSVLILIEVFKTKISQWQSPAGKAMDSVTYYRTMAVGLTMALMVVDYISPLHLLQHAGIKLW